jgi:proton-translocating NADH-quinone oxidoreductase chain N
MGILILASDNYIESHDKHKGGFYALLVFSTLAICLLGGATNLILSFLAFEFLSITSTLLIGYLREDGRSTEAALKAFLYGATLSAMTLYGISWIYGLTGSTDLHSIAVATQKTGDFLYPTLLLALIFMVAGLAFKIGAVPFHQWAPDAYEGAPTPVTAFLSIGPVIGGTAMMIRVLLIAFPPEMERLAMDWQTLLMAITTLTMTVSNLAALWQQNVKRLLAYSSIAQTGYLLIGVVTASPGGVTGTLLYLIAYVLSNLGAFAVAVSLSSDIDRDSIKNYAGLHKRAPALALAMTVCLLSLAGIPPTAGFVGRLYLFSAAIRKGLLWLAIVGVLNSALSIAYYWKIIRGMYILPAQSDERLSTPPTLAAALSVTVISILVIGILPGPLSTLLETAAQALLGQP